MGGASPGARLGCCCPRTRSDALLQSPDGRRPSSVRCLIGSLGGEFSSAPGTVCHHGSAQAVRWRKKNGQNISFLQHTLLLSTRSFGPCQKVGCAMTRAAGYASGANWTLPRGRNGIQRIRATPGSGVYLPPACCNHFTTQHQDMNPGPTLRLDIRKCLHHHAAVNQRDPGGIRPLDPTSHCPWITLDHATTEHTASASGARRGSGLSGGLRPGTDMGEKFTPDEKLACHTSSGPRLRSGNSVTGTFGWVALEGLNLPICFGTIWNYRLLPTPQALSCGTHAPYTPQNNSIPALGRDEATQTRGPLTRSYPVLVEMPEAGISISTALNTGLWPSPHLRRLVSFGVIVTSGRFPSIRRQSSGSPVTQR